MHVLGWDGADTVLKLEHVATTLENTLRWPANTSDHDAWRKQWITPFRHKIGHIIRTADMLAEVLAQLARSIRDRARVMIGAESDRGPLTKLYKAFQAALIHDLTEESFADTYAQTITYGLLTAAISRTEMSAGRHGTAFVADNVTDMVPITNPFLREMLDTFLKVGGRKNDLDFDELGIQDVVELLRGDETDLPAILRDFGNRTRGEDPVIHFYEHFLSAYNKQLKIQRGVFYTPQPVVSYIVRGVHELLQTEFGLEDGLADTTTWGAMLKKHPGMKLPPLTDEPGEKRTISPDEPFVQILDPATGTATFLVEVIDVIHRTLTAKWKQQRLTDAQRQAAWNDYVPKHLLPRLHGYELMMAPYAIAHMKIGLKLYETGYRFGSNERARIYLTNSLEPWVKQLPLVGFDALAHEAAAVNEIKWYKRFTVVIGNPPYSISSANRGNWIEGLMADYKQGLGETNLNSLSDDYIKFIRLTQHLTKASGSAVVGLITNNSFLDGITHRRIRELLLGDNHARVVNLHGSVMQRDEIPASSSDENVFDIQQGVAISIFSPRAPAMEQSVSYADLIGTRADKYARLALSRVPESKELHPQSPYFFFKPKGLGDDVEYLTGFPLNKAFINYSSGIKFRKDNLLVKKHFTRESVEQMLRDVARLADADLLAEYEFDETPDWKLKDKRHLFAKWKSEDIVKVMYRALDFRYAFYPLDRANQIIVRGDSRVELMKHVLLHKNIGLQFNRQIVGDSVSHFLASRVPTSQGTFYLGNKGQDYFAPLYLFGSDDDRRNLFSSSGARPNFTPDFLTAIAGALRVKRDVHGLPAGLTPEDIFHYAYAVFHSPGYRSRYAEFLKIDFPRLPMNSVMGWSSLGDSSRCRAVSSPPSRASTRNSSRFPVSGRRNPEVEKISWSKNTVWVDKAQTTGFVGVPEAVWNFHIGGYQVCEKWLKDRKGRRLTAADITHYQKIVVALSETIRLMEEIDDVIETYGGWPLK
ncbi:MAG: N-6 DNA methylase [Deltaproteobacteria bacterium]|nr:N-6 DNA methylase [Deltaproteobacteria bacterium]